MIYVYDSEGNLMIETESIIYAQWLVDQIPGSVMEIERRK